MAVKNSANSPSFSLDSFPAIALWVMMSTFLFQACSSSAEVIVVKEDPKVLVPTRNTDDSREVSLPREDGILRIGSPFRLNSFDPLFARTPTELRVVSLLYDQLFRIDTDGDAVPYLVDQWQVSENGLTYTFVLRNDVFYHDSDIFSNGKGRRIFAEDVKEMILRTTDPAVPSLGRELLQHVTGLTDLSTERFEVKNPALRRRSLENGVKVLNTATIQITLEKPDPRFIYKLASPVLSVYPLDVMKESETYLHSKPVGSGPYEVSRMRDSVLVLVRTTAQRSDFVNGAVTNQESEKPAEEQNRPLSYTGWDRIDFHLTAEDKMAIQELHQGNLDWIPDTGPALGQSPDKEMLQPLSPMTQEQSSPALLGRFNSFVISFYKADESAEQASPSDLSFSPIRFSSSLPGSMQNYCSVDILVPNVTVDRLDLSQTDSPYALTWLTHLASTSGLSNDQIEEQFTIHEEAALLSGMNLMTLFRDGYHAQLTSSSTLEGSDPTLWNKVKIAELRCTQPALLRKGADFSTLGLENSPVTWRIPDRLPS